VHVCVVCVCVFLCVCTYIQCVCVHLCVCVVCVCAGQCVCVYFCAFLRTSGVCVCVCAMCNCVHACARRLLCVHVYTVHTQNDQVGMRVMRSSPEVVYLDPICTRRLEGNLQDCQSESGSCYNVFIRAGA